MSAYDVNGDAITNLYDVSGTSKTNIYDVDGNSLADQWELLDRTTLETVYTNSALNAVSQGGCVGADSNVYVCFHDAGIIENYNLKSGLETQKTFTGGAYGHANGMTYNPNTGYLYIAAMQGTGNVYVLDTSMNLVDTVYAKDENNTPFSCWNIAYDRLTRKFVTLANGNMYFYDDSFQLIEYVPCDLSFITATYQDIETDGHYVYLVTDSPMYIYVFNFDGTYVKAISNSTFVGEPESLMYDWETDLYYLETFPLKIVRTEFRRRQ